MFKIFMICEYLYLNLIVNDKCLILIIIFGKINEIIYMIKDKREILVNWYIFLFKWC